MRLEDPLLRPEELLLRDDEEPRPVAVALDFVLPRPDDELLRPEEMLRVLELPLELPELALREPDPVVREPELRLEELEELLPRPLACSCSG